jgi:hypothetical protein
MAWPGVRDANDIAPGFYPIQYSIGDEEFEDNNTKYPFISETIALLDRGYSESEIYYRFGIGKKKIREYKRIFRILNGNLNHILSKLPKEVWINDFILIRTKSDMEYGPIVGVYPDYILILSRKPNAEYPYAEVYIDEINSVSFSPDESYFSRYNKYIINGYARAPRLPHGVRCALSKNYSFLSAPYY